MLHQSNSSRVMEPETILKNKAQSKKQNIRLFAVLLTIVLTASSAMAQQTGLFGVQAGLNLSNFWGSDVPESVKN